MNASTIAQPASSDARPIAPLWHTGLFLLALGGLAGLSAYRHGLPAFGGSRPTSYLITIAFEWLLAALAWWGIRLGGTPVRSVIGERWSSPKLFLRDLGIAAACLIGSNIILGALSAALHTTNSESLKRMFPQSRTEIVLWIFLSLSAGICEEFATRGYLQKQLSGLFKSATAGLLLQGIVFGMAHAYQGAKHVLTIVLLGCMLGWLAQWRKSLKPGMVAHFVQDVAGGLLKGGH